MLEPAASSGPCLAGGGEHAAAAGGRPGPRSPNSARLTMPKGIPAMMARCWGGRPSGRRGTQESRRGTAAAGLIGGFLVLAGMQAARINAGRGAGAHREALHAQRRMAGPESARARLQRSQIAPISLSTLAAQPGPGSPPLSTRHHARGGLPAEASAASACQAVQVGAAARPAAPPAPSDTLAGSQAPPPPL